MRVTNTRTVLLFLALCCLIEAKCFGASSNANVIIPQNNSPVSQRNFQNVYSAINAKPSISSGAGTPTVAPVKLGDIFINTSIGKVYIATATLTSGSWAILN